MQVATGDTGEGREAFLQFQKENLLRRWWQSHHMHNSCGQSIYLMYLCELRVCSSRFEPKNKKLDGGRISIFGSIFFPPNDEMCWFMRALPVDAFHQVN